jgi:hypothetical protein
MEICGLFIHRNKERDTAMVIVPSLLLKKLNEIES